MNSFEQFAEEFRARTSARMVEFETALDNIQKDLSKQAKQAQQVQPRQGSPNPVTPEVYSEANPYQAGRPRLTRTADTARAARPVQSVLRRI